jgi:arginine/ornithine succinyltransferase subunit-like protein
MFMAAFRDRFNEKVVAEMRGVIDDTGYSPFWESLGERFFSMEFSRADYLCGTGQKAFIAELMPKHPIYTHFLSPEAQAVIGEVHPQTAPARAVLEKEGSATVTMSTSLTAARRLSAISTACARSVKAVWLRSLKASPRRATGRPVWWRTKITPIPRHAGADQPEM